MPPRWNEPSSETWSSAGPTHAGKPSRGAVRMPRPITPRTTRPSAEPWSRRTRSRVTSVLADHSRGRAFRAPLPPKRLACTGTAELAHPNLRVAHLRRKCFVSGYRFSDTANATNQSAPLGAGYTLNQGVIHTYL